MFQDIAPYIYNNAFFADPPECGDTVLLYSGDSVLCSVSDGIIALPFYRVIAEYGLSASDRCCSFRIGETRYFVFDIAKDISVPGFEFLHSRKFRTLAPVEAVFACAVGESLHRWMNANRFCGACGGEMQAGKTERSFVCRSCGSTVYPKICPAVIVAVTDGDRLLLTRYKNRPFKRYALVAGFNEIGESIEGTVRREVFEETGLHVKNLRFYKSQPWVFTDSLLLGFFCDLDGDDRITVQEDELSEANWFLRDCIPADHSAISLTGEMIELFRNSGI